MHSKYYVLPLILYLVFLHTNISIAKDTSNLIELSFLNLEQDLKEASNNNKILMILFKQEDCSYCRFIKKINFADKSISDIISRHFYIVELDSRGNRDIRDLSGKVASEKQFSKNKNIQFSPLVILIDSNGKETFRMNGYYKPKLFKAALKYVKGKHYEKLSFNDYSSSIVESTGSGLIDEVLFSLSNDFQSFAINSRENNKEVAFLFSQERCDSCIDLHTEKFKNKEIVSALTKKYNILKVNTLGNKKIKDLNGELVTESSFSEALNIKYTPTLLFMKDDHEIFRYESYLNNEDFFIMIEYITTPAWFKHTSFQKWLRNEKIKRRIEKSK